VDNDTVHDWMLLLLLLLLMMMMTSKLPMMLF
jgi:hypothetical protein